MRRVKLEELIALAKEMQPGDAVMMRVADANQFRIILITMGYACHTDGYSCPERDKIYVFKLNRAPTEPVFNYDI